MRKVVKFAPWLVAMVALALLSGCCAVPKQPAAGPSPVAAKKWTSQKVTDKPEAPPALPSTYTVEKCDDLWSIAAKPQIYNDPWLWPLLWDANKGKISDPNKIKEGTVLMVPRGVTDAQKQQARARALAFPKYIPPKGAKRYCPPK